MKISTSLLALVSAVLFVPETVHARPFHFKATALFPVQSEVPKPEPNNPDATIVKKYSFGTKEIINLALGRPLSTKIENDIVLAVRADDQSSTPGDQRLVVFNKKTLTELAVVLILIDLPTANVGSKGGASEKGAGNGLSRGTLQATTLGTPTQNGFKQSEICGAATASNTPGETGPTTKLSMTSIVGPILANLDGVLFDGIIIKGMFTAGGRPLDPQTPPTF